MSSSRAEQVRLTSIHCWALFIVFHLAAFSSVAETVDPRLVANPEKGEWTLFVIPDTQHYSQDRSNAPIAYMHSAFDWLVETRDQLNIKFVQGLGDIVESGSFFPSGIGQASLGTNSTARFRLWSIRATTTVLA